MLHGLEDAGPELFSGNPRRSCREFGVSFNTVADDGDLKSRGAHVEIFETISDGQAA